MAYCRAGEFEKAIECLQAFTKNDELTARGRYALALAHHYAGNSVEARKYLEQALEGTRNMGLARDWVELEVLRREAETLIGKSSEETNEHQRDQNASDGE